MRLHATAKEPAYDVRVLDDGTLEMRKRTESVLINMEDFITFHTLSELRRELEDYGHEASSIDQYLRELATNQDNVWHEY